MAEVEDWRERVLLGAENTVRSRPKDEDALKDEQIKTLKQKIGELVLDNDIFLSQLGFTELCTSTKRGDRFRRRSRRSRSPR